ncbi:MULTISPECIES: DEAD/DEAH box helicase [unclassified Olleya]|jgi:superfamily II DNA/RNA helicase|uniref:DEAD/DEAH box helicase n=1 Tax=unclassified Olleya TaxID=2615019 RepID=UPI0011A070FB|nr:MULTISPECIES: DEAD/DEAH box helicase [unclassified Olleya]TVZ49824.1 RAD3-like DEAD/DEAH box helicase [Olleya sp. Hel_I_94]|tara:strand:+ start:31260 stop:31874 length:615 start_codon:yes stop_codon:yes gene_type:complete
MSFKKYHPSLKENIEKAGFETTNKFQKEVMPLIKAGTDLYAIGPKGCGKTTAMIISTIQKLGAEAFEDSPRAVIIAKDKKTTLELKERFEAFTKRTDLRIYCAYEEHDLEKQREEVYYGVDILIATPKRLSKLYHLNSLHLGELKLFVLHDADFITRNNYHNYILRLSESAPKAKFVIFSETFNPKIKAFQDSFMYNARVVDFS